MPKNQLKIIQNLFRQFADEQVLAANKISMPGSSAMYGIKMPVLNDIAKKYKENGFDLVELLWQGGV
jgi:hypothetical protein